MNSFLAVGGFVYLDAQRRIVSVKTLVPSERASGGLQFGRMRPWDPQWTQALMRHGRFQVITIKALNDLGAKHFCWLRPGELILDASGQPFSEQPQIPHGGFAYLFHDSVASTDDAELALDGYFPVVSGDEYVPAVGNEDATRRRMARFTLVSDLAELEELRDQLARAPTNTLNQQVTELQGRLEALTQCVVCQDQEKDTILDCGHLCACADCARRLRQCPLCRAPVQVTRRAYTS